MPDNDQLTLGLSRALSSIGDRMSVLTAFAAIDDDEPTFGALRRRLDVADAVLATRLRHLTGSGLLERRPLPDQPRRSLYEPTAIARQLWMVRLSMWRWDHTWAPSTPGARRHVTHSECGKRVVPTFGCAACDAIGVTPHDVTTETSVRLQRELNLPGSRRRSRLASTHEPDAATILGDSWSMPVLGGALLGAQSFTELKGTLGGISTATLSEKLRQFEETGLLHRVPGDRARRRPYRVTPKARTFFPIFAALVDWSRAFADDPGMTFTHRQCAQRLQPQYTCNSCNAVLTGASTRFTR